MKSLAHHGPGFRTCLLGVLALAACSASCMKPDQESDFFPGRGSAVTGDDATPERSGERKDGEEELDAGTSPETPDERDSASARPADSLAKVDGGDPMKQLPSSSTNDPLGDGGQSAPNRLDAGTPDMAGQALRKLTFQVTTVTARGRYSPKNILAIWVVDGQGKFVKTLAKHAGIRARWLSGWNGASRGNVVDAVTSATLTSHGMRSVSWDLTDVSKKPVPDGDYKLVAEFTEKDGTGVSTEVAFTKGSMPLQLTPADGPNFTKMRLLLE